MTDSSCSLSPCPSSCLGRTCLEWRSDGELSGLDFHLVMERLAQVDQELAALPQISASRDPEAIGGVPVPAKPQSRWLRRQSRAASAWVSMRQSEVGMATQVKMKPAAIWPTSRRT